LTQFRCVCMSAFTLSYSYMVWPQGHCRIYSSCLTEWSLKPFCFISGIQNFYTEIMRSVQLNKLTSLKWTSLGSYSADREISCFCGTRRYNIVYTRGHLCTKCWFNWINVISLEPISLRSNLILSFICTYVSKVSFQFEGSPKKILTCACPPQFINLIAIMVFWSSLWYYHVSGVPWLIITDSEFGHWIYWRPVHNHS
jgi:hypothetical protein